MMADPTEQITVARKASPAARLSHRDIHQGTDAEFVDAEGMLID
jgi:hypothetical protein